MVIDMARESNHWRGMSVLSRAMWIIHVAREWKRFWWFTCHVIDSRGTWIHWRATSKKHWPARYKTWRGTSILWHATWTLSRATWILSYFTLFFIHMPRQWFQFVLVQNYHLGNFALLYQYMPSTQKHTHNSPRWMNADDWTIVPSHTQP